LNQKPQQSIKRLGL